MVRLLVVMTCLYLLLRHPLFIGDLLWAAKAGASFVSSLAEAEGVENCKPQVNAEGMVELCIGDRW